MPNGGIGTCPPPLKRFLLHNLLVSFVRYAYLLHIFSLQFKVTILLRTEGGGEDVIFHSLHILQLLVSFLATFWAINLHDISCS
jgi:hypothetical protein